MPTVGGPPDRVPRRIVIAGTSGAGKTTLARQVGEKLGLPHTEIDALFHGPDWTPRPEFQADIEELVQQERWVTEWQYPAARPLLAAHADTLLWLDYPRALIMWRVVKRTLKRWATREELWNGNREPGLWHAFTHKEGIARWAWETYELTEERVRQLEASGAQIDIVRLRSPRQASAWLQRAQAALAASELMRP